VENWTCKACQQYPHTTATVFNSNKDGIGYVSYESDDNEIIVAFSGTNPFDVQQWIDDLDFFKTSYPYCSSSGCQVHEGFYKTYLSVKDQVRNLTKSYLNSHPSATITVTGHSLGAALAAHTMADFKANPIGGTVTTAYTFGMPRVGDEAFEKWYVSTVPGTYRVVHRKDPVPHVPPMSFGFHHMPYEIFYETDYKKWKECSAEGEDNSCSNQYYAALDVRKSLSSSFPILSII
jgi:predicted lipase